MFQTTTILLSLHFAEKRSNHTMYKSEIPPTERLYKLLVLTNLAHLDLPNCLALTKFCHCIEHTLQSQKTTPIFAE